MRRLERVQLCPGAVDGCREDCKRLTETSARPAGTACLLVCQSHKTGSGSGINPLCKCGYINYVTSVVKCFGKTVGLFKSYQESVRRFGGSIGVF